MKKIMRKSKGSWIIVSLGAAMISLSVSTANAEEIVNSAGNDATIEATVKPETNIAEESEKATETLSEESFTEAMTETSSEASPTNLLSDTLSDNLSKPIQAFDETVDDTLIKGKDNVKAEIPQEIPSKKATSEADSQLEAKSESVTPEVAPLKMLTMTTTAEAAVKTHTVKSGEYLYLIAGRYGITVAQLKQWNHLTSNYIYSGDQLKVSAGPVTTKPSDPNTSQPTENENTETTTNSYYTVRPGDYLWKIASQYGITVSQLKTWNNLTSNYIYSGDRFIVSKTSTTPSPNPSTPAPTKTYYTVKSGDYLWKIATQHGITVNQLKSWNQLTSNYIYAGDKLAVTDPAQVTTPVKTEPEKPVKPEEPKKPTQPTKPEEPEKPVEPTKPAAKYHTVKSGEYLWLIANQNNITVNQLKSWNNLTSNYIYSGDRLIVTDPTKTTPTSPTNPTDPNLPEGTLTGTHMAVQAVLNQYKNSPIHVFYESLVEDDLRTASLNGDTAMYGASIPKIVLVAYTLEQVEKGNLSWDMPLKYTPSVYNYAESYAWGGSGTIQYENYQNKTYTLRDVLNRTIVNSDNLGSNMLLHYVGYRDKADFNRFTKEVYGAPSYTRNMTPREINKVMAYIYEHPQQQAMLSLDHTDYDKTKLDTVAANVFQKIGAWWPYYNHSTAIVESSRPYILTVLSDYWSDSSIATLAKKIFTAVMS